MSVNFLFIFNHFLHRKLLNCFWTLFFCTPLTRVLCVDNWKRSVIGQNVNSVPCFDFGFNFLTSVLTVKNNVFWSNWPWRWDFRIGVNSKTSAGRCFRRLGIKKHKQNICLQVFYGNHLRSLPKHLQVDVFTKHLPAGISWFCHEVVLAQNVCRHVFRTSAP